ncbi:phospholipase D-like domain-containing protein [Vibrio penaeicida]|uniref:phospholipase D-like domain-containing protein n=1 Tax=Vibrio penaeicida TaxID=104609 RepID=UPI000CE9BA7E|nr:phospholipase D-like domain-containing protein [Vibrio penaeicida]
MNREQLHELLKSSIEDHRLDDSERRELNDKLSNAELNQEDRSFLRNQSFKLAHQNINDGADASSIVRWLEKTIKVLDNAKSDAGGDLVGCWFSPGRSCAEGIIKQLNQARHTIDICVFTIADDELTKHIIKAHQRGVKVRVVTDNDKIFDKGNDVNYLVEKGVEVKVDTTSYHMHHKFAIFDGVRLLNGSFNWTRSASKYNEEDITLTDDARFVKPYQKQFEQLWQKFPFHQPEIA